MAHFKKLKNYFTNNLFFVEWGSYLACKQASSRKLLSFQKNSQIHSLVVIMLHQVRVARDCCCCQSCSCCCLFAAKSVAAGPFLDSRQNDNNKSKKSSVNEMLATTVTKFQSGGGLKRAIKLFCCRAGARSGLGVMG